MTLQQQRERAAKLSGMIAFYNNVYDVAMRADGSFHAKYHGGQGFDSSYHGQANVCGWKKIKQLKGLQEAVVAVTIDGQFISTRDQWNAWLLDDVIEMPLLERLCNVNYAENYIIGVDKTKKAIIHNTALTEDAEINRIAGEFAKWGPVNDIAILHARHLVGIGDDKLYYCRGGYFALEDVSFLQWNDIVTVCGYEALKQDVIIGLKKDGKLVRNIPISQNNLRYNGLVQMFELTDVVQIVSDPVGAFIWALLADGRVVYPSANGLVTVAENVVAIKCEKSAHIAMVKTDGSVYIYETWRVDAEPRVLPVKLFESLDNFELQLQETYQKTDEYLAALKAEEQELNAQLPSLEGVFKKKKREAVLDQLRQIEILSRCDNPSYSTNYFNKTSGSYSLEQLQAMSATNIKSTGQKNKKDASVIGRAVAGGVIAGPVGAIVGAVSALDHNNKNK